jgi:hypothetical protein
MDVRPGESLGIFVCTKVCVRVCVDHFVSKWRYLCHADRRLFLTGRWPCSLLSPLSTLLVLPGVECYFELPLLVYSLCDITNILTEAKEIPH